MRHLKRGRKLNRSDSHRRAMVRNLVTSLFEHGRVITSPAKAKEARPVAEKLITLAKRGTLADRRRAIAELNDKHVVGQLFDVIAPRYAERPGGYCRILHMDGRRVGDNGSKCLFELVEEEIRGKKESKKRAKATVKAAATESSSDATEEESAVPAAEESDEAESPPVEESADKAEQNDEAEEKKEE